MDLKSIGNKVLQYSPLVAGAIAGPAGTMVATLLSNFLGVTPDEIPKVLDADPKIALDLKKFEYQHAEELARIDATNYQTEVDDRKDARKNIVDKDFMRHMAYLVTAGFFIVLFLMFYPDLNLILNDQEKQMMALLIGVLVSKWQTIIDFFYGSSNRH